jgi:cation diffusion facilitator family transporter
MLTASPGARDRTARIKRVLLGLLVANLAVVGAKFVIGVSTGSLSLLGDGVHSAVDAMNNVLALAVTHIAANPPDEDHPYGHRKFETLGALAIVVFLSISGFELVKGAVTRLTTGSPALSLSSLELGVLVGTLAVNAAVAAYESREGHRLESPLLLADATHTRADVFITIGVLAGLLFTQSGYTFVDPLVALAVAVVIGVLALQIVRRAIPVLVDEQAHPARVIRQSAESVTGVYRAYRIRSRSAPDEAFAELTIAVDGGASVEVAHEIADAVEQRLRIDLRFTDVVVHVEPC